MPKHLGGGMQSKAMPAGSDLNYDRLGYLMALIGRAKKKSSRPQMTCFSAAIWGRAKKGLLVLTCPVFH